MSITDPVAVPVLVAGCVGLALGLARWLPGVELPGRPARTVALDGLRGYLALSVALHHAAIWRAYLATDRWEVPDSSLAAHAGRSAVAMFFMITGFLFVRKIRASGPSGPDWTRLYVGRVLRIGPLYLAVTAAMLALVAIASGARLRVPLPELAESLVRWAALGMGGQPDVNAVVPTFVLVAGVMWTLRYEWLFYAALPLVALAAGRRPTAPWLLVGAAAALATAAFGPDPALLACFGVGALGARLADVPRAARALRSRAVAAAGLAGAGLGCALHPSDHPLLSLVPFAALFLAIACGNDLFGALRAAASRRLGELSYGVYLVHGLVLYVAFAYLPGAARASGASGAAHWLVTLALVPVAVALAGAGHRFVERPGIGATPAATHALARLSGAARARARPAAWRRRSA